MTGLDNFTDISKNPLTLPDYYGMQENSEMLPDKVPVSDEQKKIHKAKRPDDKIDRESKSLRRQNDRNLERRQRPTEESKQEAPKNQMNDMFYKKESDRQIFSGTESEFEEIAELNPNKKVLKITDSDFENDLVVKDKSRGGSKKPNFASNNSQKD